MSRAVVDPNSFGHTVYEDNVPALDAIPTGLPVPGRTLESYFVQTRPFAFRQDYRGTPQQLHRIYLLPDELRARVTTLRKLPIIIPRSSPSGSTIRMATVTNKGFRGDMTGLQDWNRLSK